MTKPKTSSPAPAPSSITLAEELSRRITNIDIRAKAAGSNMTRLCARTGIARATVERWGYRAPQTITKVDELEAAVAELEAMSPEERSEFNGRSAAATASGPEGKRRVVAEAPAAAPAKKAPARKVVTEKSPAKKAARATR